MIIIGHHTCSSEGLISDIENNGPFQSTHDEQDLDGSQQKFLGSGYYFWDNNISMAHSHGQTNYKRKYYIFEGIIKLSDEYFLDLVGNRIDMINFMEILEKIKLIGKETENWTLGHIIEFLKLHNNFPYRAIRAIDVGAKPNNTLKFVPNRSNFTNLNPIFILCLLDVKNDILTSFKHIRTFPV